MYPVHVLVLLQALSILYVLTVSVHDGSVLLGNVKCVTTAVSCITVLCDFQF